MKQLIKACQVKRTQFKDNGQSVSKERQKDCLIAIKKVSLLEIELVVALIQSRVEHLFKSI